MTPPIPNELGVGDWPVLNDPIISVMRDEALIQPLYAGRCVGACLQAWRFVVFCVFNQITTSINTRELATLPPPPLPHPPPSQGGSQVDRCALNH